MYFSKRSFNEKCDELAADIKEQKVTSPTWAWVGIGAIAGLLISCVRHKRPQAKPILGAQRKGINNHGRTNNNGNSSVN